MVWLEQYWKLLVEKVVYRRSLGLIFCVGTIDGLQRHVKILGVFSRLWLRDQKPDYMRDIPVVIEYIREACELYRDDYPAIADFWQWFERAVLPTAVQADWYEAT